MTTGHRPDMTRLFGRYDGIDPIWRAKTKKAGEHIVSYSFVTVFQWMNRRWGHRSAIGLKRITPFLFPMFHGTLKGGGSQLRLFKGNQTPDQKLRYTKPSQFLGNEKMFRYTTLLLSPGHNFSSSVITAFVTVKP